MLPACTTDPATPSVEEQIAALGEIDYNFHVRPILSQNCYLCHGPDPGTREEDLRLDIAEEAYAQRDSLPAITPGKPDESLLHLRITADDVEERMPPPEAHKELTPLQIGILTRWIEQGAAFKPHWAFISPSRPDIPEMEEGWARNEIDAFVLATLKQKGLSPSVEADRRTLIRRLSFDLTGLPPTSEEITTFLEDTSVNAYENLVDRFLASPRFGERMALHWLERSPVCRHQRLLDRWRAAHVDMARLGDSGLQWQYAVRPVRYRTTRWRSPSQTHKWSVDRHGIQPQQHEHARRRYDSRGKPHELRRRPG